MTREELLQRLGSNEDHFVERKPDSVSDDEIRKTVVAFANSVPCEREALLFIGVYDDGTIEGCVNTDKKQKKIRKLCEQDCYPPIRFVSEVLPVDDRSVVAVIIKSSDNRPHFSGPAFVRRGSESVSASQDVFDELVHSRNSTAAAVLKLKNRVVTVESLGHRLGETGRKASGTYVEYPECLVIECDAHNVRLQIIASQRFVREPLKHVDVTYDEEKHRDKLVVRSY